MPRATLKIQSNTELVALSNAHPEAHFKMLNAWPSEETVRVFLETSTVDLESLEKTLSNVPGITDSEIRHADTRAILFEVSTPIPIPHGAMAESGVVPSFPMYLEDGWLSGDLITSHKQLSLFQEELRAAEIEYQLISISSTDIETSLLTERQQAVIELALEQGYYDSPRECTLTDLAEKLSVDKSVVSRILHRAEGRIITDFLESNRDG